MNHNPFNVTPEEIQAIESEVHDQNSPIVKFCVEYIKEHPSQSHPIECYGHHIYNLEEERDMLMALCEHMGITFTPSKERQMLIMRWMVAGKTIKQELDK